MTCSGDITSWLFCPICLNVALYGKNSRRHDIAQKTCKEKCLLMLPRCCKFYGAAFVLAGIVLYVYFGYYVIQPALSAERFQAGGTCETRDIHATGTRTLCTCGRFCWSHFPCLQIYVDVYVKGVRKQSNVFLHENELNLHEFGPSSKQQCSTSSVCAPEESVNVNYVNYFKWKYRKDLNRNVYGCLYNADNYSEVIIFRKTSRSEMVHCLVWPGVLIVVGLVLVFATDCNSCQRFCSGWRHRVVLLPRNQELTTTVSFSEHEQIVENDELQQEATHGSRQESHVPPEQADLPDCLRF